MANTMASSWSKGQGLQKTLDLGEEGGGGGGGGRGGGGGGGGERAGRGKRAGQGSGFEGSVTVRLG